MIEDRDLEVIRRINECAGRVFADGVTTTDLYWQAQAEEITGFTVSAAYTRLLAQAVEELETAQGRSAIIPSTWAEFIRSGARYEPGSLPGETPETAVQSSLDCSIAESRTTASRG